MNVINKTIEQTTAHLKFDAIKTLIEHSPIENEFLYQKTPKNQEFQQSAEHYFRFTEGTERIRNANGPK